MNLFKKYFDRKNFKQQSKIDIQLLNAIIDNSYEEVKYLLNSGANPNTFDVNFLPVILISSSMQQINIVESLINFGADVNAKGTDKLASIYNLTALQAASANGCIEIVNLLLKANAQVNSSDDTGLTSLMASTFKGNSEIVKVLLQNGAQIEQKDKMGYTALMFGTNAGKYDTVKILIENNANVNARDKDNSTPIMFAAQHGHNEVVKLLLKNGADKYYKGKHGLNAVDFAKQNSLKDTLEILEPI